MRARDYIQGDESMAEAAYRFLAEHVLTEPRTDFAIEWAKAKAKGLKVWIFPVPVGLIGRVLDRMLPEKALELIRDFMVDKGLLSERRSHPSNPFTR